MTKITEQVFRDGNQSLVASRITLEDMLPIAPKLDEAGFFPWKSGAAPSLSAVCDS